MYTEWLSNRNSCCRISRHSPSAIANTKSIKSHNKSRGLEITDQLIEHSWFRRKFGGFAWPTLVSWFYMDARYMDRLGREIVARRRTTSIKRNCRPARNGKGGLDRFPEKRRKEKNGPLLRRSMAVDSCFSIFYDLPTPSYNYVRTYTTYCHFCRQWCRFTYISTQISSVILLFF